MFFFRIDSSIDFLVAELLSQTKIKEIIKAHKDFKEHK